MAFQLFHACIAILNRLKKRHLNIYCLISLTLVFILNLYITSNQSWTQDCIHRCLVTERKWKMCRRLTTPFFYFLCHHSALPLSLSLSLSRTFSLVHSPLTLLISANPRSCQSHLPLSTVQTVLMPPSLSVTLRVCISRVDLCVYLFQRPWNHNDVYICLWSNCVWGKFIK